MAYGVRYPVVTLPTTGSRVDRTGAALRSGVLGECWHTVRLALTALWRARSFSVVAIGTLALGIGAVTIMFALVEGVLLRRWPVADQSRLIVAWKQLPASGFDHYPF